MTPTPPHLNGEEADSICADLALAAGPAGELGGLAAAIPARAARSVAASHATVDLEIDPVGRLAAALAGQAAPRIDVAEALRLAGRAKRVEPSGEFPRQRAQHLHAQRIAVGAHVGIEHGKSVVRAARLAVHGGDHFIDGPEALDRMVHVAVAADEHAELGKAHALERQQPLRIARLEALQAPTRAMRGQGLDQADTAPAIDESQYLDA